MVYDSARTPSLKSKNNTRVIPSMPEKILDAPDIMDDYCEQRALTKSLKFLKLF
jgi:hypothetical protein